MSSRRPERLSCRVQGQTAIVSLQDMEIWDGADLSRLREILTRMIIDDGYRSVGVDLSSVKYIPSGFFGMLYEWYESGGGGAPTQLPRGAWPDQRRGPGQA